MGLGVLLEQERRDFAAADGKEGLIGEQLDAALGVEDIGDGDLLAFGLQVDISAERAGGTAEGCDTLAIDPELAGLARLADRLLAKVSSPLTS